MHPPSRYGDAAIVRDDVMLNGSKMTADFGTSNYFVQVAGAWVTVDLFGHHEDRVTYGFIVKEQ